MTIYLHDHRPFIDIKALSQTDPLLKANCNIALVINLSEPPAHKGIESIHKEQSLVYKCHLVI